MAKKKNGNGQPQPLSVGKFVDRVIALRSERDSAVDKVRSDVERRFRERESKLLERVPERERMTAQACLLAAEEQRGGTGGGAVGSVDPEMAARVGEPPV